MSPLARRYVLKTMAPQIVGFVVFLIVLAALMVGWILTMWPNLRHPISMGFTL